MKKVKSKNNFNAKSGYVMLLITIIFMMVSLIIIFGLSTTIIKQVFLSRDIWNAKQSYYLSEAGIEDVMYRLNDAIFSSKLLSVETLSLDGYNAVTQITSNADGKTITTLSNQNGYKKTIETKVIQGSDISFNYGIFANGGGFTITGGSDVTGNIYSNGDVLGDSVTVFGSVIAASSSKILGDGKKYFFIGSTSTDMAWASYVSHVSLTGNLYCLTGTDNADGKICNTGKGIPDVMPMPISEVNINQWKTEATLGGTHSGDFTVGSEGDIFGPGKITGNLTVDGGGTLMVNGTIWVTGNIIMTNGGHIKISPSLGSKSVIILTDGYANIIGGGSIEGSGTAGSYPVVISTSVCPNKISCAINNSAIYVSNGSGSVVLIAPYGKVDIEGGSGTCSVSGDSIYLDHGAHVIYDKGLESLSFNSGPSGSWTISSWKELEN